MKFVRLAALVGSLVLLVATAVSVLHRRGDIRSDQETRVEQTAMSASVSVRNTIERAGSSVQLASAVLAQNPDADTAPIAGELVGLFDDAEACVAASTTACTGSNLLALDVVGDLGTASTSDQSGEAAAQVGVHDNEPALVVAQRVVVDGVRVTVAVSIGQDSLLDSDSDADARVDTRSAPDERSDIVVRDGQRIITEIIGSEFVDGSVEITSRVDGSIGILGDEPARYGVLLALGTVLLALAGWTFRVERSQLEKRATTDELTGLINRREFERVSEEELDVADRFNSGLCVMVVDLNGFKQVNDTMGHQFGDLVLEACSQRLVAAVRDTDVVGRWGGDEFVILLPGLADRAAVRKSAERIWRSLADSPVVGDTVMTASIGAAMFPRHGVTLDSLMRAADVAMYAAKTTGVSHRIADTIVVSESAVGDGGADAPVEIATEQYAGPDRRHSPVPPPPMPDEDLARPVPLPLPDTGARAEEPPDVEHDENRPVTS